MTETPFDQFKSLIEKGYPPNQICSELLARLGSLNMRSAGKPQHYDASGNYVPPAQVICEALTYADLSEIESALAEFNLYWRDTKEGRAVFPHQQFLNFLSNRTDAGRL